MAPAQDRGPKEESNVDSGSAVIQNAVQELQPWNSQNLKSFESFNKMIADRGLLSDEFGLL